PRLSRGADGPDPVGHDLRRHQSGRGPALHGPRSAHPLRMSALWRHPMILVGGLILAVVVITSAAAPWLAPSDPVRPSFAQRLTPPHGLGGASAHPLGTDNLGRDILARLLYGGRLSLALAAGAVALA